MKLRFQREILAVCLFTGLSLCNSEAADNGKDTSSRKILVKSVPEPVRTGIFQQQIRTNYEVKDGLPNLNVLSVYFDKDVYAATSNGIARFENDRWKTILSTTTPVTALTAADGSVWFVRDNLIYELQPSTAKKIIEAVPTGTNLQSLISIDRTIYVGTNTGLFVVSSGKLVPVEAVNHLLHEGQDVHQLAYRSGELAVAASGGLISYRAESKDAKHLKPRSRMASWAPVDVHGVGFDADGNLWFASHQGVGKRTGKHWQLYTGNDGLPYNDFTGLATGASNDVWFGTKIGAIRFDGKNWEYRQGKRWLAEDVVNSIAVAPSGDAWIATPAGVTRIEPKSITLREKAAFFNSEIYQYLRRTPYGYVDAASLESPGDKSKCTLHDSDNDGLWTSMYGAAECFEYAVTRTPESKKRANEAFRAVAFLSEVTQGGEHGAPFGFPARSILPTSGPNPNDRDTRERDLQIQKQDPLWKVLEPRWPVSADGKWYWKTDTSSDELDGHYFFYGLYNDLVAETDEEKSQVKTVVERISSHLLDHGDALVDHDGKPTRWARFGPEVLNKDVLTDCRGLNSVSYLSYLIVANHVTGDEKYRKHYHDLLEHHNYYTNVLSAKHHNGPGSGNQSDDEMAFMCYYSLFVYERDPKLRHQYMRSLARYFVQEEPEACPLFSLIFASLYEPIRGHWKATPTSLIHDSVETLHRFPLDRIHWGYKNSHRTDIVPLGPHIPQFNGRGHLRNGKVLPIDERYVNHWNHDPWRLDSNSTGRELADGASFLLPYWLGVYHGLIEEGPTPAK